MRRERVSHPLLVAFGRPDPAASEASKTAMAADPFGGRRRFCPEPELRSDRTAACGPPGAAAFGPQGDFHVSAQTEARRGRRRTGRRRPHARRRSGQVARAPRPAPHGVRFRPTFRVNFLPRAARRAAFTSGGPRGPGFGNRARRHGDARAIAPLLGLARSPVPCGVLRRRRGAPHLDLGRRRRHLHPHRGHLRPRGRLRARHLGSGGSDQRAKAQTEQRRTEQRAGGHGRPPDAS